MNTTQMKWWKVAPAEAIPLNEGRSVAYGEQTAALFNLGGEFCAVENKCPHKGGPLADGIVAGKSVFCPLHNWKIDLGSGCAVSGGTGQVQTFPVRLIDGDVYIAFEKQETKKDESRII